MIAFGPACQSLEWVILFPFQDFLGKLDFLMHSISLWFEFVKLTTWPWTMVPVCPFFVFLNIYFSFLSVFLALVLCTDLSSLLFRLCGGLPRWSTVYLWFLSNVHSFSLRSVCIPCDFLQSPEISLFLALSIYDGISHVQFAALVRHSFFFSFLFLLVCLLLLHIK